MSELRFPARIDGVRAQLTPRATGDTAVPVLILTTLENVRYLTGFTGSNAAILISDDVLVFFTDGRYALQSETEVPGFERVILPSGTNLAQAAGERARALGFTTVGFEANHLTYNAWRTLELAVGDGVALVGCSGVVEQVREIKDASELAAIRRATALVDACVLHLQSFLRVGLTEREVAWEIEMFLRTRGATRLAFDTIVGSGPNAALIHGRAGERVLGSSGGPEFVLCDFGCELGGYCSDITRTFVVGGTPTDEMRRIYDTVLGSQLAALDAIKPGVVGREVDAVAREHIRAAGFGNMMHGLGHGLGRVVHDVPLPTFSPLATVVLRPGVVATVEPGIYIEGLGGVRIEDDIVVTETGIEILTTASKALCVVGN